MNKQKRKGFTIVELVIVIAVIAILSAVLIPTFGGVVQNAESTANKQAARNAYVEYVASCTDGIFEDNVIVLAKDAENNADDVYYTIVNGEVGAVTSTPTNNCVIVEGKVWATTTHADSTPGDDTENKCAHCGKAADALPAVQG